MRTLLTGGTLRTSDTALLISFDRPRRSLSTAIWGGGFRDILFALNQKLTGVYLREEDFPGGSVAGYLRKMLLEAGCDPGKSSALLTSARMEWHRYAFRTKGALTVEVIATGGVEKTAARAGDPPLYEERCGTFFPVGTINLMALVNGSLPDGIMARALVTLTEGKTAAFQDLGIAAVYTGRAATGTATDGVTLITDPEGPVYTDAGTFSALGSMLAACAHEAVTHCLTDFDRPWNRTDALRTPPAVDLAPLKHS